MHVKYYLPSLPYDEAVILFRGTTITKVDQSKKSRVVDFVEESRLVDFCKTRV